MNKCWILIWLFLFYSFSALGQKRSKEAKNYVGVSYVEGSIDRGAYEFSYERLVNLLQIRTGLRFSIIPNYQYDDFGPKGIPAVFKNYSKQNLITLEATPYLFTGRKRDQNKGFFLRAGPFITPFHLKYDKIVTLYLLGDRDVVYNKVNKYILDFGIGGSIGYQFGLFGSRKRIRIEFGGRTTLRMNEPGVIMLKAAMGIGF